VNPVDLGIPVAEELGVEVPEFWPNRPKNGCAVVDVPLTAGVGVGDGDVTLTEGVVPNLMGDP